MVQYVLTPWWDRNELLLVRDQFYAASSDNSSSPSPARRYASHPEGSEVSNQDHHARSQPSQSADADGGTTDQQRQAVARVSMWMQRGNCPHLVEATALLTAAVLSDHFGGADAGGSYAVRAAYSAAFSRAPKRDACREAVLEYLRGEGDDTQREKTMRRLGGFDKDRVLAVIAVLQAELPGNQVYLRCLKLSKEIMMRVDEEEKEDEENGDDDDDGGVGQEESLDGAAAESSSGWWLYEGEWKAKPIGMV
ncbi:rRNA-processing protein las1 [Metarhizium acridum]|uniref:rRNA-processing protein las1 n=1 Tax=Metarhizium acridum TaxID=92637 RepID=UPI001C6BB3E3|nr:rRNA-processing protein las1 [Metarhizium acridum]